MRLIVLKKYDKENIIYHLSFRIVCQINLWIVWGINSFYCIMKVIVRVIWISLQCLKLCRDDLVAVVVLFWELTAVEVLTTRKVDKDSATSEMLNIESILYIIDVSDFTIHIQSKLKEHMIDFLNRNKMIHRQRGKKMKNI